MLANDPFTIVHLPDTQTLTESSPAVFTDQTQWVADHIQSDNIVFLSHVGDMVQDPEDDTQWQIGDSAMSILDGDPVANPNGLLPYSVAIGNHDFDDDNTHLGATQFTEYFGQSRYVGKTWYGGSSFDELNHFQFFSANGQQFLHLTVEWEPRDSAVNWAQGILDAYADVPTVLTTHAYIDETGGHSTEQLTIDGRSGEQVFQDLVSPNPQIFMVLGGHFGRERHQVSLNSGGSEVIEILANYQGRSPGEDGFLRLIEFDPDANAVNFTTYSPTLDEFETDADSQFTLSLDFANRFSFSKAPRARLATPADNGVDDLSMETQRATVNTVQQLFDISLLDFSPGIDPNSVTNATTTLFKDGVPLSQASDYSFTYDPVSDQISLVPTSGTFDDGVFEISLNSGSEKIADQDGNELESVIITVEIDTTIPDPPTSFYFSLNNAATLPGGLVVDNEDIVFFDGTSFSQAFDGSDVGLSAFTINALDFLSDTELLFSMKEAGSIPGIPGTVDDSDIIKFTATQLGPTTAGTFELFFDGSDVELISGGEDIDSVDMLDDGRLLISIRGTLTTTALVGGDDDIFAFTPISLGDDTSGTWELFFDGADVGLGNEDLNGVSVYPNGDVYLSVDGSFDLAGSTVRDDDVLSFSPLELDDYTVGDFTPFFDGSLYGLSPFDMFSLHVPQPVTGNSAPVANNDSLSVSEGSTAVQLSSGALSVLENDTDADLPDDSLTVELIPLSGPSFGSVSLNTDGTFSYTHDGSENFSDSFVYEIHDALGATDTAVVSITIIPVNDNAPVANNDSIFLAQGATTTQLVGGSNSLTDNDTDLDLPNDSLMVSVVPVSPPLYGSLTLNNDGTFSYTHDGAGSISDSFVYQVSDSSGTNDIATVSISIGPPNSPPSASDGTVATLEDTAIEFGTSDFNFTDADGDSLAQIQITSLQTDGSLRLSGVDVETGQVLLASDLTAGHLQYTPAANVNGADHDSFRFRVHDGIEYSGDDYRMTIDVTAVNDAPVLSGLPDLSIVENTTDTTIDLDNFFSDVETPASAAQFTVLSSFTGVNVTIDAVSHVLTIVGDPGFVGDGDITIQATDTGDGTSEPISATDTLHVTVSPTMGDSAFLFSLDRTETLGGITVANEDILKFDGIDFSMVFDGSDVGISSSKFDAFTWLSSTEMLFSISAPQYVPGITEIVDDSDIVKFTGTQFGDQTAGTFELYFDGSDVGLLGSSNDIDAVEILADGRLLVSMTGSDTVSGLSIKDDDIVAFVPSSLGDVTSGTWEVYFDGSDVALSPEDVRGLFIDDSGDFHFSVQNDFFIGGVSGEDEDVFVFSPRSLGPDTDGSYSNTLYFDGSVYGISSAELSGIDLVQVSSLPAIAAVHGEPVGGRFVNGIGARLLVANFSPKENVFTHASSDSSKEHLDLPARRPKILPAANVNQVHSIVPVSKLQNKPLNADLADEFFRDESI